MRTLFYIIIALFLTGKQAYAQETVNGGFELTSAKSISRGWTTSSKSTAYRIQLDQTHTHTGKYALKLEADSTGTASEAIIYNAYGLSSANPIINIEVSAWVNITHAADSALGIFIQSLNGRQIISTFAKASLSAHNNWQKMTVRYTVDAKQPWAGFYYGLTINKPALAFADDVTVKVDGKLITDPKSLYFEPSVNDINWLNKQLMPLTSVALQSHYKDMDAIGRFCGDANVIGIGEPTHGTHEALQFKLRLLEYLVTKKGFNTIALEEVIPICDQMNEILNTSPESIKDSLMTMPFYKLWKTAEMNDVFNWVSRHNQTHQNKVKLIGLDMEDIRIQSSRKMIREIGLKLDKAILSQVGIINQNFDRLVATKSTQTELTQLQTLANSLKAELNKLDNLVNKKDEKIDQEQLFKLQTYIRVCLQWLDTRFLNPSTDARDRYMASNMKFYIDHHPKAKVLVWAHNAHIANLNRGGTKTMGSLLKEIYGKAYLAIAFTSASGGYTAAEDYTQKVWKAYTFETAYRGTYPYVLGKAKSQLYFLPLNTSAIKQKGAGWLQLPMKQLDIPYIQSGMDEDYHDLGIISASFDGVVFCKKTTAAESYLKQ